MLRDMSARDDNPSEVPGKAVCLDGRFIVDLACLLGNYYCRSKCWPILIHIDWPAFRFPMILDHQS
jgi:hypothetical protein